jgi:hypothetical protein
MRTTSIVASTLLSFSILYSSMPGAGAGAQTPAGTPVVDKRTYNWYGELVSVDEAGKTATARVPVEAPVATYFDRFKPGDKVILVFTANAGKPDTGPVLYMAALDTMRASKVDVGYILPAEYVSGDSAGRTVTVKVALPDSAVPAVKGVTAGQWIKATAPMVQPGEKAVIASVAGTSKPAPFVRDAPPAPAAKPEEKKGA